MGRGIHPTDMHMCILVELGEPARSSLSEVTIICFVSLDPDSLTACTHWVYSGSLLVDQVDLPSEGGHCRATDRLLPNHVPSRAPAVGENPDREVLPAMSVKSLIEKMRRRMLLVILFQPRQGSKQTDCARE